MRFNWEGSGHNPDNTGQSPDRWILPFPSYVAYTNPNAQAPAAGTTESLGKTMFGILTDARRYLDVKVQEHTPCNECFRRLRGGRSFKEVYNDPDVWVNYNGALNVTYSAFVFPGSKDIVIHNSTIMRGPMFVAAALVHEMSHINGSSGSQTSQEAENTLKFCLLTQYFNPNVFGTIDDFTRPPGAGNAYA